MALVFILSCEKTTDSDQAVIEGTVYSLQNSVITPLEGALVTAKNFYTQAKTDAAGVFSLELDLIEEEKEITLQISKAGFQLSEVSVMAKKDITIQAPDITLSAIAGEDSIVTPIDTMTTSEEAAHIEVDGVHESHIYIKSTGLKESALISFLVTDAKGVPVDQEHKVTVNFSILNGPGGGEYLYPAEMETENGKVYTILNSGISAGAVQIQATAQVNGVVLRALPIRLAIHGGLPDEDHFSVSFEKLNIAGQVHNGIIDKVTAYVGDKYSNPVAPGTAVYFSSDYCIIEGMALTDEMGRATARFMSAGPKPPDPSVNPFVQITAQTFSDTLGQKKISAQRNLLLTGRTAPIQVSPASFTYSDLNQPIQFTYTVSDIWGYPIVGGSSIAVEATEGSLYGDVGIEMLDTQYACPGTTEFSFSWAPGDSLEAPQVYISITVTTPELGNGYRSVQISGSKN